MRFEKKRGSQFLVVKTRGIDPGSYDLYDIRGLSLGKLRVIIDAMLEKTGPLAEDIFTILLTCQDDRQTVNNR